MKEIYIEGLLKPKVKVKVCRVLFNAAAKTDAAKKEKILARFALFTSGVWNPLQDKDDIRAPLHEMRHKREKVLPEIGYLTVNFGFNLNSLDVSYYETTYGLDAYDILKAAGFKCSLEKLDLPNDRKQDNRPTPITNALLQNPHKNKVEMQRLVAQVLKKIPDWESVPDDPNLWQGFIRFFFKALETKEPERFRHTPRKLFMEQCDLRCDVECQRFNINAQQWLSLCAGNLAFIEAVPNESLKWRYNLYKAAAEEFGHTEAVTLAYALWQKISSTKKDYSSISISLFKLAAKYNHTQIIKALLKHSDLVRSFDAGFFNTVILENSAYGNHEIVKMLLQQTLRPVEDEIDLGYSLIKAARAGHLQTVVVLLQHKSIGDNFICEAYKKSYGNKDTEIAFLLMEVCKARYPGKVNFEEMPKIQGAEIHLDVEGAGKLMERYNVPLQPFNLSSSHLFSTRSLPFTKFAPGDEESTYHQKREALKY